MEVDERDAFVRIDVGGRFVIGVLASCLPVYKLDPDLSDVDRAEADVVGEFLPDNVSFGPIDIGQKLTKLTL